MSLNWLVFFTFI